MTTPAMTATPASQPTASTPKPLHLNYAPPCARVRANAKALPWEMDTAFSMQIQPRTTSPLTEARTFSTTSAARLHPRHLRTLVRSCTLHTVCRIVIENGRVGFAMIIILSEHMQRHVGRWQVALPMLRSTTLLPPGTHDTVYIGERHQCRFVFYSYELT